MSDNDNCVICSAFAHAKTAIGANYMLNELDQDIVRAVINPFFKFIQQMSATLKGIDKQALLFFPKESISIAFGQVLERTTSSWMAIIASQNRSFTPDKEWLRHYVVTVLTALDAILITARGTTQSDFDQLVSQHAAIHTKYWLHSKREKGEIALDRFYQDLRVKQLRSNETMN